MRSVINLNQIGLSMHKGPWSHAVFALCNAPTAAVQPSLNTCQHLQRDKSIGNWALLILLLKNGLFCYRGKALPLLPKLHNSNMWFSACPWYCCLGLQASPAPPTISQLRRKQPGTRGTCLCVCWKPGCWEVSQANGHPFSNLEERKNSRSSLSACASIK